MENLDILVVGGGIGGLTAAIALCRKGHQVRVIEKDPEWSVYGVGIIQQANVIRAMHQLGVLDAFLDAASGFDAVDIFLPDGTHAACIPTPSLVEGKPANVGISRRALQKVLGDEALGLGTELKLGLTVDKLEESDSGVFVALSDGSKAQYDLVIGADGAYSQIRSMIFPGTPKPQFTGQSVWRYNFPRPADLHALQVYNGPIGAGLVPISATLMYMYVTTPEPDKPRYPKDGIAASMRGKLSRCAPTIRKLGEQITDDEEVVYRPLETMLLPRPWHKGRIVLLGDAVHATTPHLGQGAGMAIEDSLVLADELTACSDIEDALRAYEERRFERCRYIVESSFAICQGQLGKGPSIDNQKATADMFAVVSQPI